MRGIVRDRPFCVRLSEAELRAAEAAAAERDLSVSQLLRQGLRITLQERPEPRSQAGVLAAPATKTAPELGA